MTQRYKYQEVGLLGAISEAACHILQPELPSPKSASQGLCNFEDSSQLSIYQFITEDFPNQSTPKLITLSFF